VRIRGRCHCGNISFRLDWEPDPVEIPARSCDCTFCMKPGGTWTSYSAGKLDGPGGLRHKDVAAVYRQRKVNEK